MLKRAPRRFQTEEEGGWEGRPSVIYGVVRRLAYEERKKATARGGLMYARVFLSDVGRRGDPWGGLGLEINGQVFRFGAGVHRWPHFHDGKGELTEGGKRALAYGVPGLLTQKTDWRWVQEETFLPGSIDQEMIYAISRHFSRILDEDCPIPRFQARTWARRLEVPIHEDTHNCTTIILKQLRIHGRFVVEADMPVPAMDQLISRAEVDLTADQLEHEQRLHALLSMTEDELTEQLLVSTSDYFDWNRFAKGELTPPIGWGRFFSQIK